MEPCGLWHSAQSSLTGAWSKSMGPRYSAWQLLHNSLVVARVSWPLATAACGLWQSVQTIAAGRVGCVVSSG